MASRFPKSGDNDVEIRLTSDHQDGTFLLHSYVLALHSKWFKASVSERWNGTKSPSDGIMGRWVYELRFDKDDTFGLLARQAESKESESTTTEVIQRTLPQNASATTKNIHKQRLHGVDVHRSMFEAMYHMSLIVPNSIREAKTSMPQLAEVAEAYGCQQVVKIHLTNHLSFHRDKALDCCASDPLEVLQLATATKSCWLFAEASIFVIGL